MARPLRLPGIEEQPLLDQLEIHLLLDRDQQDRWNQLVLEQHYLHTATLVGEQLRYAASYQGQWLALLGWNAAAWHLEAREAWLNWSEGQRRRRLHFLAQNSRFLILADRTQFPSLGTRAMRLCLDRLSQDWQTIHELDGVFRKCEEYALGYIFREVRIANHAQRGGIDEVNVPAHQFGKRRFRAPFSVGAQQL
jgi:hypothetical protein